MPFADSERNRQFTEQLERHHRRLYGYIFTFAANHQDAQDVFQQTSLVLWEKFDEFRPDTNFLTWACSVARFKALDFEKQQRRYRTRFSDAFELQLATVHANIPAEEFEARSDSLEDCVEKLPPSQRAILLDCFTGGRSVAELAEELGRTPHSVYSSLRNIREKLLRCVKAAVSEEGIGHERQPRPIARNAIPYVAGMRRPANRTGCSKARGRLRHQSPDSGAGRLPADGCRIVHLIARQKSDGSVAPCHSGIIRPKRTSTLAASTPNSLPNFGFLDNTLHVTSSLFSRAGRWRTWWQR